MQPDVKPHPQLLLDLSELVKHDARSGIQRVVRSVLQALLASPPSGYVVRPVYDAGGYYAYALAASDEHGAPRYLPAPAGEELPLQVAPGDIFFGLDLALEQVVRNRALLASLQAHGVRLHFFIYDLLPVRHPEWFDAGVAAAFGRWLQAVAELADGLVCDSRATADDLLDWLDSAPPRRALPLQVGYAHLGADLAASMPSRGIDADDAALLEHVRQRPTLLMVGTLEPRKMHGQVLQAFDALWRQGEDVNLVIIGKPGWLAGHVAQRLQRHAERGRRLFWQERASDELLEQLYRDSAALLAASAGEGFGLPLIEAAQHGLPVIARDLPVFHEVGGDHAWYFHADGAPELAAAIHDWLALYRDGQAPASAAMPHLDWAESTRHILRCLLGQQWYAAAPTRL